MARPPAHAGRWTARPRLALLVRVLVVGVPVLVGVLTGLVAAMVLPSADGAGRPLWWLAVLAASTAGLLLTDRLARRALPLAVLLELSLVFPDRAPSRLRAARTSSVAEIERRLDRLRADGADGPAVEAAETLVILVGVLGLHDKRTRGHSERVRALTDLLTAELGLSEDDRAKLRWASLVHDLGKLRVPVSVLNGGKDLADDEWEALRRHPEEGQRLAGGFVPWLGEWGRTIVEHHERWDGRGYPYGLSGEQISYGARIVAVADSFEVMTGARSYAPARSAAAAREELARCAGSQFDPEVVRAFLGISVRRLSWVLGPLTWAAQVPLVATVDRAGQFVKVASVVVLTAGLLGSAAVTSPSFGPWERPDDVAAADDVGLASGERGGARTGTAAGADGQASPGDGTGWMGGADDGGLLAVAPQDLSSRTAGTDATVLATELRRDAAMAARGPAPATTPAAAGAAPAPAPAGAPGPAPAPAAAPAPAPAPAAPAPAPAAPAPAPPADTGAEPATPAEPGEPGEPATPAEPADPQRPSKR